MGLEELPLFLLIFPFPLPNPPWGFLHTSPYHHILESGSGWDKPHGQCHITHICSPMGIGGPSRRNHLFCLRASAAKNSAKTRSTGPATSQLPGKLSVTINISTQSQLSFPQAVHHGEDAEHHQEGDMV